MSGLVGMNSFHVASRRTRGPFHEGFADVIALPLVFPQQKVVEAVLDLDERTARRHRHSRGATRRSAIEGGLLRTRPSSGSPGQMGQEMQTVRGSALRRSVELTPGLLADPDFIAGRTWEHHV